MYLRLKNCFSKLKKKINLKISFLTLLWTCGSKRQAKLWSKFFWISLITLCSGKIVTLNFVFKKKFDLLMVYCVVEDHVLTLIKHRKMCHFQSILSKLWILKKYSWKYYSVKRIKLYYLTDFGEICCVHSCYRVNNKIIIVFYAKLYWTSFLLTFKKLINFNELFILKFVSDFNFIGAKMISN